jgi:hypothetical protein
VQYSLEGLVACVRAIHSSIWAGHSAGTTVSGLLHAHVVRDTPWLCLPNRAQSAPELKTCVIQVFEGSIVTSYLSQVPKVLLAESHHASCMLLALQSSCCCYSPVNLTLLSTLPASSTTPDIDHRFVNI